MPAGPALSAETRRRSEQLFHGDDARAAAKMLERECGNDVPFCERLDSVQMQRNRFAALEVSGGKIETLRETVAQAKLDWRDLLMWAGFGSDVMRTRSACCLRPPREVPSALAPLTDPNMMAPFIRCTGIRPRLRA